MLTLALIPLLWFQTATLSHLLGVALYLSSATSPPLQQTISDLPKGQIIDKVECAEDPSQSYAVYLPASYTPERKWPILYAFDPAARGKLPVERFKEAAEKYNWIVVGSNNSRNGPMQPSIAAWNAMAKDTQQRFSIDMARAYVAGFSGGSRAAVMVGALCRDCIAGVIVCGGGFPAGLNPSSEHHFTFFGAAGTDDFNFPEVKGLDEPLTKAGINHRIVVFAGRHEWAPSPVAIEALEWFELVAMRARLRESDDKFVAAAWQRAREQAAALESSQQSYEAYQIYLGMLSAFKDLRDLNEIDRKLSELRETRPVKDAIRSEQQQIKKQHDLENRIRTLIVARDGRVRADGASNMGDADDPNAGRNNAGEMGLDPSAQLRSLITDLRKQSKAAEDSAERRIARRVLEGVAISLFEQGRDLLQTEKRYGKAIQSLQLATEVNPDRAGAFFYLAWAYAANNEKKKALQALKSAIDKGFVDLAAITENHAFDQLRNDPQYVELINALKSKR